MKEKIAKLRGLIAKSLNANRNSWRSFFKKYGFAVIPANPEKRIVELYRTHGDVVLTDINQILATGDIDGFSKDDLGKIVDTFDIWLDNGIEKPDDYIPKPKTDEDKPADEGKSTKWVVGAFVGLCVVSILAFVLIRKFNR